ncbi:MAG TPA: diacylglycerol kinase family protein [Streptosporangiaceae bacterium]|nr:diacylglycerol kinase family protein [Streptosporangiaceae bacterium]
MTSASSAGGGRFAAVVVNPTRVRGLDRLRQQCAQAAADRGWQPPQILTTSRGELGDGITRAALEAGAGLIVCAGGDGTVAACAQALAGTSVPLAIVPAGSANLTARALGIPVALDAALATAFGGRDRRVDLATADGTLFVAMAGIGLDAAVVGATPDAAKRLIGWPAYAGAAAVQLLRPAATFTVRLDGERTLTRRARSVTIGNSGALPGGFPIMPDARLDDGLLDVVILAPSGLLGWVQVGLRVVTGSHQDDSQLERHRARQVEIHADTELPRQVDGEVIAGSRSLTVAIRPGALLVRVPG